MILTTNYFCLWNIYDKNFNQHLLLLFWQLLCNAVSLCVSLFQVIWSFWCSFIPCFLVEFSLPSTLLPRQTGLHKPYRRIHNNIYLDTVRSFSFSWRQVMQFDLEQGLPLHNLDEIRSDGRVPPISMDIMMGICKTCY